MPLALTNNAVAGARGDGGWYVYSFGGLDSSLIWSGIRREAFRYSPYSPNGSRWLELPPVPDTLGKIASAASTVKDKIYVIGGYHVLEDGTEISSDRVHIFDPATNAWLEDGAPLPVPVDDHVQVVYRDSLIYVIGGWSQTSTVGAVQIYNPSTNTWQAGTALPPGPAFRAFGAAGSISSYDDSVTIAYAGGARMGINFPMARYLRVGRFHPSNPTEIRWTAVESDLAGVYRGVMFPSYNTPDHYLAGGAAATYNFDALAYSDGDTVQPRGHAYAVCITFLEGYWEGAELGCSDLTPGFLPMDLRGVAIRPLPFDHQHPGSGYLIGGIGFDRKLTGLAYEIDYNASGLPTLEKLGLRVYPNPSSGILQIEAEQHASGQIWSYQVFGPGGEHLNQGTLRPPSQLDLSLLPNGTYYLLLEHGGKKAFGPVVIAH